MFGCKAFTDGIALKPPIQEDLVCGQECIGGDNLFKYLIIIIVSMVSQSINVKIEEL